MEMRKVPRTALRSWMLRHLKTEQGGLCAVCKQPIDTNIKGEGVVDHDHKTGEIRGVLHRSCNAAEGKVANAAGRWGCKGMDYEKIIPYLGGLVQYLKQPGTGWVYPYHKTPDELREAKNSKARLARAAAKAKRALKGK